MYLVTTATDDNPDMILLSFYFYFHCDVFVYEHLKDFNGVYVQLRSKLRSVSINIRNSNRSLINVEISYFLE